MPILDGSAASFVFLLQSAGIELQNAPKRFLRVKKPVEIREGEGAALKWARLEPYHGYKLAFEIEFDHPAVDATGQRVEFDFGSGQYKRDIARARTFGFTKDVEMMRSRGLGLGGSMDNVIVVDDYRVLNADGLRYDDEFVKHKILDAIGDLHIAGKPLLASYTAFKSGHALNNKLLRKLLADAAAYEIVSFERRGRRAARLCRAGAGLVRCAPMLLFRLVFGLLLVAGVLCFAMYIGTSQPVWRQRGLLIVKWTVLAGAGLLRRAHPRTPGADALMPPRSATFSRAGATSSGLGRIRR